MANLREVKELIAPLGIPLVLDASLISENAYFIRQREPGYENSTIREIVLEMMKLSDLCYLSGRKSCMVRGGLIATNNKDLYNAIRPWLPVYEGFYTYGGMSSKEIEAMAVGMREMTDLEVAGSSADAIKYFCNRLISNGVPVVTPPGGLACHLDAMRFAPHLPQTDYPAGALGAATFIVSGIRGMERGTISMDRDEQGNDVPSDIELLRLAVPRRVFTMSHFIYATDRVKWLHEHRDMIGGLEFYEEPPILRFFGGKLKPKNDWGAKLAAAFEKDFGPDC
jgi:tryptophanase